jgi:hypothetical protein
MEEKMENTNETKVNIKKEFSNILKVKADEKGIEPEERKRRV